MEIVSNSEATEILQIADHPVDTQPTEIVKIVDKRSEEFKEFPYKPVVDPMEFMEGKYYPIPEGNPNYRNLTFQQWNEEQEPHNRIYHPAEFDVEPPKKISCGSYDASVKYIKDGKQGEYAEQKIFPEGKTSGSITLLGPTVVSQSGYRKLKPTVDHCIAFVMDMNNPQHRHFLMYVYKEFIRLVIEIMLGQPTNYGLKCDAFPEITDQVRSSPDYIREIQFIYERDMSHFWSYPKKDKTVDKNSNLRSCFLNPLEIEASENSKGYKSEITIVRKKSLGNHKINLKTLSIISEGWEHDRVKRKEKGFEFSFSVSFPRITKTKGPSCKATPSSITIYDIFESRRALRQTDIIALKMSELITDENDFASVIGVENFADTIIDEENRSHKLKPVEDNNERNKSPEKSRNQRNQSSNDSVYTKGTKEVLSNMDINKRGTSTKQSNQRRYEDDAVSDIQEESDFHNDYESEVSVRDNRNGSSRRRNGSKNRDHNDFDDDSSQHTRDNDGSYDRRGKNDMRRNDQPPNRKYDDRYEEYDERDRNNRHHRN